LIILTSVNKAHKTTNRTVKTLKNFSINEIFVGMKASTSHLVTDEKTRAFASVSKDYNPIHLDEEYAKSSSFGKRLANGAIVASFFSALFAMKLLGVCCFHYHFN